MRYSNTVLSIAALLGLSACDTANPSQVIEGDATVVADATVDQSVAPDVDVPDQAVVDRDAAPDAAPDAALDARLPDGALDGAVADAAVDAVADAAVDAAPIALDQLAINEIECRGDEWIEVMALDAPVDLSGWTLSDDRAGPGWALPAQVLDPDGVLRVDGFEFGIGCDERVFLRRPDGSVGAEAVSGDPRRGLTWGRLPDGVGDWQPTRPTPGAPNAAPWGIEVRLNEVDCAGGDFIELINIGDGPADLAGWTIADDPAQAGDRLDLVLDPGAIVALTRDDGLSFGIGCDEVVVLRDQAGVEVDRVALQAQPRAFSWGRLPDGAGDFARALPTPGAPNLSIDDEVHFFHPDRLTDIHLTLPPEAIAELGREPREYVEGTLAIEDGAAIVVGIRLKGRLGSFRTLDRKSGFKVKIDQVPGQRLNGLEKLTLNNMVQDRSMLHEWLAYTVFRDMGVAAPRTGYARVFLNDELYGVYNNLETLDEQMLDRWFARTDSLYEGAYGTDLFPDHLARFEMDEGDDERVDLQALIERLNGVPAAEFYAMSQDIIDWPQVLAMMVTEIYIGHWDGYAPTRNNYYFHFADGVASLLPWGTDQTFDRHLGWRDGRGLVLERCRASVDCMAAFDATLAYLVGRLDALDLIPAVQAHADRMIPWVVPHARSAHNANSIADGVRRTIAFLERRRNDVRAEVDCFLAEDPDPDGDGFTCRDDCNPDDNTVFPGAPDLCGDGIDQDCNGIVDDGIDCPDCTELARGGRRYLACTTPRTYADAAAHCAEYDAQLAVPDDPAEAAWLLANALQVRNQDYWIGLDDLEDEGEFRWVDGSPVTLSNWARGEPNNAGGREHCAHFWARNGQLNDLPCDARIGVLCEEPCAAADGDGDGADRCGADCNDDDPLILPGGADLCADGIDQDCDGEVDEGEPGAQCLDCEPIVRGPHRYLACESRLVWADARVECQTLGMDLAVLSTPSEISDISAAARPVANALLVGLGDHDNEGTFVWVDGTEVDEMTPWLPNEPNDFGQGEDCAQLRADRVGLNDIFCDQAGAFLCEDTCAPGEDADGDGVLKCGGDCDDGDPNVGLCAE